MGYLAANCLHGLGSPGEGRLGDEAAALVLVEIATPAANSPPGNCRFQRETQ
jgi:hypothetical protein